MEQKFATLNTASRIPLLGFGTGSAPGVPPEQISDAISCAIKVGYRHFDTASIYGSEAPLGLALSQAFDAGLIQREDVFVTSKLWCTDNYPDGVIPALKNSLRVLQLEYLDLYLIHWPVRWKKEASFFHSQEDRYLPLDIKGTWRVLEECVELGLTKAIGVSNFSSKKLDDLLTYAKILPAVNQVEMHPRWQQPKLREFCNKFNIHVSAFSPLGAPSTPWGATAVIDNATIKEISREHGKTPAQVVLRWGVEQGVSVLPKSFNTERILENSQIFDWHLTEEDREKIGKLEQKKIIVGKEFCNATTSPYKTPQELWDEEV